MQLLSFFRKNIEIPKFFESREHFIPFRGDVLLDKMLHDTRLNVNDHRALRQFKLLLAARFHYEYHDVLESLKNDFVPFDPDRETLGEPEMTEEQLQTIRLRLYRSLKHVLHIGNYIELTPEQLAKCLELQPMGGLSVHVDTEDFDEFHVYYRGIRQRQETEKIFFFWKQTRPLTYLNRVFIIARFKPENGGNVIIKMFKDVAIESLKIIAPKVKLGMPVFDRIKIGGSVFGSLITPLTKLIFAFTMSWIYFSIILFGFLIAAFKGFMSFLNSKTKYMHVFSSSLYYRNLSNNNAALTTLLDAAEVQELKETLIGYFILYIHPDRKMTLEEIDIEAERWIFESFGHHLDFEVDDAVRKLHEKGLVSASIRKTDQGEEQIFQARPIRESLRRLDEDWGNFFNPQRDIDAA